ncbi:unnamed protein product [Albugo candida]|uniref:BEACH domain-containing protein n=1 Tax=Albugo candida TaxID=65357 RepID=A0A024G146_9STRA|nr:unnamed protein product [Albugo candida]|eukprot:CCI40035.1 unnamed protein product [Albugo candida]
METSGNASAESDSDTNSAVTAFFSKILNHPISASENASQLRIDKPSALHNLISESIATVSDSTAVAILTKAIELVKNNCFNIELCITYGVPSQILSYLDTNRAFIVSDDHSQENQAAQSTKQPSLAVTEKLLRLLVYLSRHSVRIEDVRQMFRSIYCTQSEENATWNETAIGVYFSTLEMIARDSIGPSSYFDLSEEASGLIIPKWEVFPAQGYTFCVWVKFEVLPEIRAPFFQFCGSTGVGVMGSFHRASLLLTCFDKKKNDALVEVKDLVVVGRWQLISIVHTHRQIRGSKVDVYVDQKLSHSSKFSYPNVSLMNPIVNAFIGMRHRHREYLTASCASSRSDSITGAMSLRVLLGPVALLGQTLSTSVIENIHSAEEFDALILQFNSYISSSTSSNSSANTPSVGSFGTLASLGVASTASTSGTTSIEGLLFAYDARNCDRLKGLCFDSSGHGMHAQAAGVGVRLRHTTHLKQAIAQLAGPTICLPFLFSPANWSVLDAQSKDIANENSLQTQFQEEIDFLKHLAGLHIRPFPPKCVPKAIILIAELLRHSPVNKFTFRRHSGVRNMALLLRSLPPSHLTLDIYIALERMRSAVLSDRSLSTEIAKHLLYNFRIWVNAPFPLQCTIFDKLETAIRNDESRLTISLSIRHFVHYLSWIYWKDSPVDNLSMPRNRYFTPSEIQHFRGRILGIIRILLCQSNTEISTSASKLLLGLASNPKAHSPQALLSYENTRVLVYCMVGKATNPIGVTHSPTTWNGSFDAGADGQPPQRASEAEMEAGAVVDVVPSSELPDLFKVLLHFLHESSTRQEMYETLNRLGGLRLWLPLLASKHISVQVMTLRLLRSLEHISCHPVVSDIVEASVVSALQSIDRVHLSVTESYLIVNALLHSESPMDMTVYTEILLFLLDAPFSQNYSEYESFLDDEALEKATIWHSNLIFPFLASLRTAPIALRLVSVRHFQVLFGSDTTESASNRQLILFHQRQKSGGASDPSKTTLSSEVSVVMTSVPILEAFLNLRGELDACTSSSCKWTDGFSGIPDAPLSRLREMVLNQELDEETRISALYGVVEMEDMTFLWSLLTNSEEDGGKILPDKAISKEMKFILVQLLATMASKECIDFITRTCIALLSSFVHYEAKRNDIAWTLLQDPLSIVACVISPTQYREEHERVVMTLLKMTLLKLDKALSNEISLRTNLDMLSRDSILIRNAENIATICAAVVLHYDPDTLGAIDPSRSLEQRSSLVLVCGEKPSHHAQKEENDHSDDSVYWKCERVLDQESELLDAILSIWQHLTPLLHAERDAAFGGTAASSTRRAGEYRSTSESGPISPSGHSSFSSRGSIGSSCGKLCYLRPHPGGPMRQILQLLLRSFYLLFLEPRTSVSHSAEDESNSEEEDTALTLATQKALVFSNANSLSAMNFMKQIRKLEYFIHSLGFGKEGAHFESSFTPSNRFGKSAFTDDVSSGLISQSKLVKASPGNETALVLWVVPELVKVVERAQASHWVEEVTHLSTIIESLVASPFQSFQELEILMEKHDFVQNGIEVQRRDDFYHEQLSYSQQNRMVQANAIVRYQQNEMRNAATEIERMVNASLEAKMEHRFGKNTPPLWLQRVRALDIQDWTRLVVELKWGIAHMWGSMEDEKNSITIKESWRVDTYTSSNWIRGRLVPDTDESCRYTSTMTEDMKPSDVSVQVMIEDVDEDLIGMKDTGIHEEANDEGGNEVILDIDAAGNDALAPKSSEQHVSFLTSEVCEPKATSTKRDGRNTRSKITTLSTRFSSGVRRFTSSRNSKRQNHEEEPLENRRSMHSTTDIDQVRGVTRQSRARSVSMSDDIVTGTTPAKSPEPEHDTLTLKMPTNRSSTGSSGKSRRGIKHPRNEHWKNLSGVFRTQAYLVLPCGLLIEGILRLGQSTLVFEGIHVTSLQQLANKANPFVILQHSDTHALQLKRRVWGIRVIRSMYRRRFLLDGMNGLEFYFVDGNSCFFGLHRDDDVDLIYAIVRERKPPCLVKTSKAFLPADRMFAKMKWTDMWRRREISNFEYLMLLNIAAGRSYNDIAQYPILPWILKEYQSTTLDLEDPNSFRDLAKPIGAQSHARIQQIQSLYDRQSTAFAKAGTQRRTPPYHFSRSYSHTRSILYFLIRLMPLTRVARNRSMEKTTQSFNSISEAFHLSTCSEDCCFELTPEFFTLPDFLTSGRNRLLCERFGTLPDVQLPLWASSAYDFIHQHRAALESDHVSSNLHPWIDLIFGYKQAGPAAVSSCNVYHIGCSPDRLDVEALDTPSRAKVWKRGVLPFQLFKKPHPRRMTQDEALESRYPASHAMASLSSRLQIRRCDLQSKHTSMISNIWFSSAIILNGLITSVVSHSSPNLGSGTGMGAHSSTSSEHSTVMYTCDDTGLVLARRYVDNLPDQTRSCPFSFVDIDQWWKLPEGCSVRGGMVFYEQMISCGYWDGSWRIHWSADGELLQRIAFHKKRILCMSRSEDDFTGDLALAFGSEDCTVSVWALSKLAATRPRRLFTKKEYPVGGLPWVLLYGHTSPVSAVALNVDLDIVASSSATTVLIHSLRSEVPLHRLELISVPGNTDFLGQVRQLIISSNGDTMIHLATQSSHSDVFGRNEELPHSELFLVSMNGTIISHDRIKKADGSASVLLECGMCFTRSGEYFITATADGDTAIEMRDARTPSRVARRIDCKRESKLTSMCLSNDERCVVCGFQDGTMIAYAFHFGIADGCKSINDMNKKAREQVAEALARAKKPIQTALTRQVRSGKGRNQGQLWIRSGKLHMPENEILCSMQYCFIKLKQPCISGDQAYEKLLREFWLAIYDASMHLDKKANHLKRTTNVLIDMSVPPEEKFERIGQSWSRLGFQRPDPTTDFRAGGMLSLYCLLYFVTHYQHQVRLQPIDHSIDVSLQATSMIAHQIPGSHEHTYPWGPVGINLTCLVARFFWNSDGELSRERSVNWPFFTEMDAFYMIFCEVFLLFDYLWKEMNANYGSFSRVMAVARHRVLQVLEEVKGDIYLFVLELKSKNAGMVTRTRARCIASDAEHVDSMQTEEYNMEGLDFLNGEESELFSDVNNRSSQIDLLDIDLPFQEEHFLAPIGAEGHTTISGLQAQERDIVDPFAGNDLRDFVARADSINEIQSLCEIPSQTASKEAEDDDPFAALRDA